MYNINGEKTVKKYIDRTNDWFIEEKWKGYDPYDIKVHPILQISDEVFTYKLMQKIIKFIEPFAPVFLRKLLNIKKSHNPKALGLIASAYKILYNKTMEQSYLESGKKMLDWLEGNSIRGYRGLCWGHPFSWQSLIFIPAYTPSSVITAIIGDAFLRFYRETGLRHYLKCCESICEFFINDLNIQKIDEDKICFSKTPVDNFLIHNSNLFVSDFLFKIGTELKNDVYIENAERALNYTLNQQNENGSIYYWGREQGREKHIDHYHSGYDIRCLYSIWKTTNKESVYKALKKYYDFYCNEMFEDGRIPKIKPDRLYPVDIHSCAEAILCNSTLAIDFKIACNFLKKCIPWILKNMWNDRGWFIYRIDNYRGIYRRKMNVPYIRWGQAWMFRALVQYYSLLNENKE